MIRKWIRFWPRLQEYWPSKGGSCLYRFGCHKTTNS